jgi:hypothetical protein
MVKLRSDELWAAACIHAALPGVTVGQHDNNMASNMHDLDLSIGGGRTFGAIEITAAVDETLIKGQKVLDRRDGRWCEPELAGGWAVNLRPEARLNRLSQELPPLLRALEEDGFTSLDQTLPDELRARLAKLGVTRADQYGTDFRGSIYPMLEMPTDRMGGWVASTGDALSDWISEWVVGPSRSDNLTKLRRSAAPERHLFVIVPGFVGTAPFSIGDLLLRVDAPLPTTSPRLPAEITHVWIMGTWANRHGFRWSPDSGWVLFANEAVVDQSW